MDSGFSVLFGKLAAVGVCCSAVIKERRIWSKYILVGETIEKHFEGKKVGSGDAQLGWLEGHCFKIFCCSKEEDKVMKLMPTYGALRLVDQGKTQRLMTENGQHVSKSFAKLF